MPDRAPDSVAVDAGLVFSSSPSGHRGSYVALLASLLGLQPVCASLTIPVMVRLVGARALLLATFDDHVFSFALLSLVRGLLGRPTVGLMLRPHGCFDRSRLKSRLRRHAFLLIRRTPRLTLITVTPFSLEPHYASVAHVGAHDPQYWDLHDGRQIRAPGRTSLSDKIEGAAAGRRILCVPGALILLRGIGFLASILREHPQLREHLLVVAAGIARPDARDALQDLGAAGALVIERRLGDAELESLYVIADVVWSCYDPTYDQASGIFGRAIQLGVPVIVRRGSLIDRFASGQQLPVVSLEYGDVTEGATVLAGGLPPRREGEERAQHADLVKGWRDDFVERVARGLEAIPPYLDAGSR